MFDYQTLTETKTFYKHPKAQEIYNKVSTALDYFPEVKFLKLGAMGMKGGRGFANYSAVDMLMRFHINIMPDYNVIFHELGHALQERGVKCIPHGEEAATIFALARMPEHLIESNRLPYFKNVPAKDIPQYCKMAIEQYNKGNRTYIKWLRKQIDADLVAKYGGKNIEDGYDPYINGEERSYIKYVCNQCGYTSSDDRDMGSHLLHEHQHVKLMYTYYVQ